MMHDWTLVTLVFDWLKGIATITFKNSYSQEVTLIAEGVAELKIPKREDWGESASVNKVDIPTALDNGNFYLQIEIQSGDKIEFEAKKISFSDS
ncbi:hypothetical protein C942_02449 [Photobacterium marinum]|uniref:Uncharacterized protein n=1 Tax=Photobacterium marinum TaxID=1056511 RepID=L8J6M3_9GAMM|nr:hypothetical protein [Photobacterium marinum]ELR64426.1 hypothetical protein C942_02449 [Photobacterium marinum]